MSIGVLLVDDQALVRGGLAMVIESQDDMRVVGEVGDGEAVVAQLRRVPADVVLMDIRMPRVDGISATEQVLEEFGDRAPKVLILTTFDTDEHLHAALRAGAAGFILKGAPAYVACRARTCWPSRRARRTSSSPMPHA
ncbi:response regulator receiver domain-containing protein [Antricoccus suffuscus]|uniref:Response regulator receiver domain-containing protein n=1 Tax=Antricoccus suffuscus TaxID=1629062 RepID=A0A2T0ZZ34_9ACTN|nr:response regulator transcription factor [Antricoccus suffuscus]PRZ41497.1 response regulator receiver domain-containing protein [Antricoccus suffuscus]